jgi:hypothetical protein
MSTITCDPKCLTIFQWFAVFVSSSSIPVAGPPSQPPSQHLVQQVCGQQVEEVGAHTLRRGNSNLSAPGHMESGVRLHNYNWRGKPAPLYSIRALKPGGEVDEYFVGKNAVPAPKIEDDSQNASGADDSRIFSIEMIMSMIERAQREQPKLPSPMEEDVMRLHVLIRNSSTTEGIDRKGGPPPWPQHTPRKAWAKGPDNISQEEKAAWANVRNRDDDHDFPDTNWWSRERGHQKMSSTRSRSRSEGNQYRRTYVSVSVSAAPYDTIPETDGLPLPHPGTPSVLLLPPRVLLYISKRKHAAELTKTLSPRILLYRYVSPATSIDCSSPHTLIHSHTCALIPTTCVLIAGPSQQRYLKIKRDF